MKKALTALVTTVGLVLAVVFAPAAQAAGARLYNDSASTYSIAYTAAETVGVTHYIGKGGVSSISHTVQSFGFQGGCSGKVYRYSGGTWNLVANLGSRGGWQWHSISTYSGGLNQSVKVRITC